METASSNLNHIVNPRRGAKKLEEFFRKQRRSIVAYSGGVDSALLAYAANRALSNNMVAVLADSPSLSRREYRAAVNFVQINGIPLRIIRPGEMENPKYRANQPDRCYYCKQALFDKIEILRRQLQVDSEIMSWPVNYGVNVDDLGDYRPGIQAAREALVQTPYLELGFTKQIIRGICAYYKLNIADKPATPCMASRIAYGEPVTVEKLNQVEKAEDFLYDLGLRILRVRHHGDTARIEIPAEDIKALLDHRQEIVKTFRELGFLYVSLDLEGFKSGSLNAVLEKTDRIA
jgi:uncharacterized protein